MSRKQILAGGLLMAAIGAATSAIMKAPDKWVLTFGNTKGAGGVIHNNTLYTDDRGFGIEPDIHVPTPGVTSMPATAPTVTELPAGGVTSDLPFLVSIKVPSEGNYRVDVTLTGAPGGSVTTVKAEARRLMADRIAVDPGQKVTKSFVVNVRFPEIPGPAAPTIKFDPREPGSLTWDHKLTLEFIGEHPAVDRVELTKVTVPTVYLCSDSTVTDQPIEPYGTWGQMLPVFFKNTVAIADHAESGQTLKAFKMEHRWDKVMSLVKPGDYVFMQFGHNDLNVRGRNAMWPTDDPEGDWTKTYSAEADYTQELVDMANEAKAKGATPVIVSPMTKIQIGTGEVNDAGLKGYPAAAVAAAKQAGVALIDLNAMSVELVKGLGPDDAKKAYVEGLHTRSYGGYLLAECIVRGIRENHLPLANELVDNAPSIDLAHPTPVAADFKVPLEPSPARMGGRGRGPTTRTIITPANGRGM